MYPGKWAELFPDKPAVINSETEETLSFKQLEERSNQLSHYFEQNNIKNLLTTENIYKPITHVMNFSKKNPDFLIHLLHELKNFLSKNYLLLCRQHLLLHFLYPKFSY